MTEESKIAAVLGTEDEDKQVEIIQALAAPPVVITIVVTALGGISISGVGNVSNREVQNILLGALRQVIAQDVAQGKPL